MVLPHQFRVALLALGPQKASPSILEFNRILVKGGQLLAYELAREEPEQILSGGVSFMTDALIVTDQNRVERIFKYRLKVALCAIEDLSSLPVLLVHSQQRARTKKGNHAKKENYSDKRCP
jgi:hypothetical protein